MTDVVVRRLGLDEVQRHHDEIVELYRRVYSEPPYYETPEHVEIFAESFVGQSAAPGFTLIGAEESGTLVGYVYGLHYGPDQWWQYADQQPGETVGKAKYAVMELVLEKPYRGRGLGRQLVTTLLADRPEPYATLCAHPDSLARQIYHHWGWREVGQANRPDIPTLDILLLRL